MNVFYLQNEQVKCHGICTFFVYHHFKTDNFSKCVIYKYTQS